MAFSTLNHFLIGLPGSGKSTFAQILATLCPDAVIISTDRAREQLYGDQTIQGNWSEIETYLLKQVHRAIAQGQTVIYDATNSQRAHRLEWLQKVNTIIEPNNCWLGWHLQTPPETAKKWNQKRDRAVPEEVINRMQTNLDRFPPHSAEGFLKVAKIELRDTEMTKIQARHLMNRLNRSLTQQRNQSRQYHLHPYSHLLDFERLMHLLSLILQYPGLGNLRETAPETAQTLLAGTISDSADELEEIQAIMARWKGRVYADRDAIAGDLEWLEKNGFLTTGNIKEKLQIDSISEDKQQQPAAWHRYSDWEPFQRLLTLIRYLAHHPFPAEPKPASESKRQLGLQERFFQTMQNDGVLVGHTLASVREDIRQVLI